MPADWSRASSADARTLHNSPRSHAVEYVSRLTARVHSSLSDTFNHGFMGPPLRLARAYPRCLATVAERPSRSARSGALA